MGGVLRPHPLPREPNRRSEAYLIAFTSLWAPNTRRNTGYNWPRRWLPCPRDLPLNGSVSGRPGACSVYASVNRVAWLSFGLLASLVGGCTTPQRGAPVSPPARAGVVALSDLLEQGPLVLDVPAWGSFETAGEFHRYDLLLSPGQVVLDVDRADQGLDPVLFLFGPDRGEGFPVSSMMTDDAPGAAAPRLEFEVEEAGRYLLVVGTFDGLGLGNYRVSVSCESCGATVEDCSLGGGLYWSSHVFPVAKDLRGDLASGERTVSVWDASSRQAFEAVVTGDPWQETGVLYADDAPVARFVGGEVVQCDVPRGPERATCARDDECSLGLLCRGVVDGTGVCVDLGAPSPAGAGASCASEATCGEGLLCLGGICQDMADVTRATATNVAVTGSMTEVTLPMRAPGVRVAAVQLELAFEGDDDALTVEVEAPWGFVVSGAPREVVAEVRELALDDAPPAGRWRLRVAAPTGAETTLRGAALTVAASWE